MKNNKKLLALFLGVLMLSLLPVTLVSATMSGGNAIVKSGSLTFKIRYDFDGTKFYASCAYLSKQIGGPHLNVEVWSGNKQLNNYHMAWEGNCILIADSNFCKRVCFENKNKGDLDSILRVLNNIPNSARKSITSDQDAIRQYNRLGLQSTPSPYVYYAPQLGGYVAAATLSVAVIIVATILNISMRSVILSAI